MDHIFKEHIQLSMCSCSVVVHNGERIKSDSLHKKMPEEPVFREGNTLAAVRTPTESPTEFPSYLLRHGSLGADQILTDEDLQQLASILNTSQNSNNRDKMNHEEMSGSYTSIEEESEQTLA